MARLKRLTVRGVPHHVIQRGNNRQAIFFCDEDYMLYLDRLRFYAKEYKVKIHSYVLMTNHIHLLCTPSTKHGLSKLFQSLKSMGSETIDFVKFNTEIEKNYEQ